MKDHRRSVFAALLWAGAVAGFWPQPARAEEGAQGSWLQTVLSRGHLNWGIIPDNPPFALIDDKGQYTGFDVDIARIIATAMFEDPSKVEFVKISAAARWAAVNQGQIDMGQSGTTIWPSRLGKVNFTMPLLRAGHGLLARADISAKSQAELDDPKYTFAQLNFAEQTAMLKEHFPKARSIVLNTTADLLTALQTDRAQVMIADRPTAAYQATVIAGLRDMGSVAPSADDAIYLRLNDFQWLWYVNTLVQEMRCGVLYGDYSKAYQKWFGVKPPSQDICIAFSQAEFAGAMKDRE